MSETIALDLYCEREEWWGRAANALGCNSNVPSIVQNYRVHRTSISRILHYRSPEDHADVLSLLSRMARAFVEGEASP